MSSKDFNKLYFTGYFKNNEKTSHVLIDKEMRGLSSLATGIPVWWRQLESNQ